MVEQGLAPSRSIAQRLVLAGQVRVNGQVALKPSISVQPDAAIEIDQRPPFVSRGGEKLAAALSVFGVAVSDRVCADVGASTGGFTDCLLQNGAVRVYAIDVGHGILDWRLRQDQRVISMERTNARYIQQLPEPIQLVTVDVSFISLKVLFPVFKNWFPEQIGGDLIALVKPQFEAGRAVVARGAGVIRDPEIHRQVLQDVLDDAQGLGYAVRGLIRSPLLGPKGNTEFLAWIAYPGIGYQPLDELLDSVLVV